MMAFYHFHIFLFQSINDLGIKIISQNKLKTQ